MIKFAAITPHPPIIIPTIGFPDDLDKTIKTRKSMEKLAKIFKKKRIETIILISPHAPINYQRVAINISPTLFGNFEQFNDKETHLNFENDLETVDLLQQQSKLQKIPLKLIEEPILDHGSLVPLYYLAKNYSLKNNKKLKIVSIAYSYPEPKINFDFGKIIFDVCKVKGKRFAVVASGDLSHRLTLNAPGGYFPDAIEFDKQLVWLLDNNKNKEILEMNSDFIKKAGECGYLSITMLLGLIEEINKRKFKKVKFESLSYEGPFGVGYLVGYYPV